MGWIIICCLKQGTTSGLCEVAWQQAPDSFLSLCLQGHPVSLGPWPHPSRCVLFLIFFYFYQIIWDSIVLSFICSLYFISLDLVWSTPPLAIVPTSNDDVSNAWHVRVPFDSFFFCSHVLSSTLGMMIQIISQLSESTVGLTLLTTSIHIHILSSTLIQQPFLINDLNQLI